MNATSGFPKVRPSVFEQRFNAGQVPGFVSATPNHGDSELVEVNQE
jgi:hypothetical protein